MKRILLMSVLILGLFSCGSVEKAEKPEVIVEPVNNVKLQVADPDYDCSEFPSRLTTILRDYETTNYQFYLTSGKYFFERGYYNCSYEHFISAYKECETDEEREEVIEMVEEIAEEYESDFEYAAFSTGFQMIEHGMAVTAIPYFEKAIEMNPDNSRLYYEIGYAYVEIGDLPTAIAYYEIGHLLNPLDLKILKELQYCYVHVNPDMTKKYVDLIIDMYGENPQSLTEYAISLMATGDFENGLSILEQVLVDYPGYPQALSTMAQFYSVVEDYEKLHEYATELLEIIDSGEDVYDVGMDRFSDSLIEWLREVVAAYESEI